MFAIWHSIKVPNDAGLFEERAGLLATQQVQQVQKVQKVQKAQQLQKAQQAQPLVPASINADTDNSAVVTEQAPILTASATPDDLTHVAELEPAPVMMPNKPLPPATASPIEHNDSKQILASHNDNASQKPQQQASKQPATSSDSVTKRPQPITLAAQTTQSNTSNDIKPLKQVLPAKPAQTQGLAKQSSLPDAPLNANPSRPMALKLTASLDQVIANQPPTVHANALAPVEPAMAVPIAKTAPTQTNLNNQPDQAPRQIQAPPVTKQALELALAGFITAIADGNLGHIDDLLMDAVNTDNARGKQRLVQMFSHMFETSAERDFSLLGLQWASRDDRMIATTRYQLQLRHIGTAEYAAYQGRLTLEWVHQAGQVKLAGFYHGQDPLFQ
jgi:ketosteroid isomerase-like protein